MARNRLPVVGWVLYDFANTIFSLVVVTRYFNDWVIEERGQRDIYVGAMSAAVSLLLVVTLPMLGARADAEGRHKPILMVFTTLCVGLTALLGIVGPVLLAFVVAGLATFCFNVADSQYHPLLATVAPEEKRRGRVSGTGVAVGYLGSLTALFAIGAIATEGNAQAAFLPAAVLFGVFALPCFLLVREGPRRTRPEGAPAPRRALAELAATVRRARHAPHGRLLVARFFYVDALATVIQFMTVYARRTGDFGDREIDLLLAVATVAAIGGAIGAGLTAERVGPRKVVLVTLAVTVATLVLGAGTGSSALLWVLGPVVGMALGSLSAVDRIFLLRLVPEDRRGEDFSLYALVGKLSSGFGPLVLWGGTVLVMRELAGFSAFDASRVAVGVLAAAALVGLLILRPLSDAVPATT
ncbi:MAG: MFS transporter [Actinomycetota bacterium]|nr:MFS transporter [Actinomycetota bacterium]